MLDKFFAGRGLNVFQTIEPLFIGLRYELLSDLSVLLTVVTALST